MKISLLNFESDQDVAKEKQQRCLLSYDVSSVIQMPGPGEASFYRQSLKEEQLVQRPLLSRDLHSSVRAFWRRKREREATQLAEDNDLEDLDQIQFLRAADGCTDTCTAISREETGPRISEEKAGCMG